MHNSLQLQTCAGAAARFAVVGSDQQFYYSIGLTPYGSGTFYVRD